MVPADLRRQFDGIADEVGRVAEKVKDIVSSYCEGRSYAYLGRKKCLKSLAEKIEGGRFADWSSLDDLFGCSIIVPTLGHEDAAIKYLQEEFVELDLKKRGTVLQDPVVFRFGATRFIGSLPPSPVDDAGLSKVRFEVQIPTAFEHAWAVACHDLAYKGDKIEWRFECLAAQLKASVEQLDSLVATYENSAGTLVEYPWPPITDQNLILESFRAAIADGKISNEHTPERWGRFAKNVHTLLKKVRQQQHFEKMDRNKKTAFVLEQCFEEVRERGCPMTISLFQFVLGTLVQRDLIEVDFREGYYPLITPELEARFSKTASISTRFRFDG